MACNTKHSIQQISLVYLGILNILLYLSKTVWPIWPTCVYWAVKLIVNSAHIVRRSTRWVVNDAEPF